MQNQFKLRKIMTIKEMRDQITKLRFDARAVISGEKVTAENLSASDAMLTDANNLKAAVERMETFEAEERSANPIPRSAVGASVDADTRSLEEKRAATGKALRSWMQKEQFEARDLSVGSNGSVMIPTAVADAKVARKFAGGIYDLVYKLRTETGEAVKSPLIDDSAQGFVLNSAAITVTDPTTSGVTIAIDDARMNPILIENSLIQDAGFDIVSFVEKACQARYTRTVSNWITVGNASNVGGLSTISAGIQGATTLVTAYKDLSNLKNALDPAYQPGAVWTMNTTTLGQVEQILDSNNRPIFLNYNDGATSGFVGQLFGFPVKINPYLPNNAVGAKYIQFGDFEQGYTFREVLPGIVLKRGDERYFELNKVGFVAFARVGGAVTDAGTHPILTLTGK
jgi:HK97 family phage major capsid protein